MFQITRKKIALTLFITIYGLLFGEMFVRIFTPVAIIPRYVTAAPYGVRMGMPNMRFMQTTPETKIEVRTNSHGLRTDHEYTYEKPAGVCRVLLFGDSLFLGYEVNIEDSFAYLLDQKLKASGYQCEVINLAVSGFGTAEMLITLQKEGLKYHPDIVIFSSHETDLDDNIRSDLFTLNTQGQLVRKAKSFLPGIELSDVLSRYMVYRWLAENSQLYSALRERAAYQIKEFLFKFKLEQSTDMKTATIENRSSHVNGANSKSQFSGELNLKLLHEARLVANSLGAHFAVLEIPSNKSRTEFVRELPAYDSETIRELNIFDPMAAFQSASNPSEKLYFEKGHGHLTPKGNHLLTDFFFERLKDTGWLN